MNIEEFSIKYHGIVLQPHQLRWVEFLDNVKNRGILLAPRGHGKTTVVNLIWLSWVIVNNPTIRVLLVSHSKQMAESFSRSVRAVMDITELQEEFDFRIGTPWRSDSWRLEDSPQAKPTLETRGAMGRMTGWRGDMVIFDDLLEINNIMNESIRQKMDHWIKQEVLPAINPHPVDKIVVVGTRKHIDDWYGQLLINPDYENMTDVAFTNEEETECLWPYILDENGEQIAPMWTIDKLKWKRGEQGSLLFAQEYMNQPSPPEGMDFKMDWLRYYEHLPQWGMDYYIGIDPSSGKKGDRIKSYFAMVVVAHDTEFDRIYVVDMYRGKDSKVRQSDKAIEWALKYGPRMIYVETVFEYTHVYEALRSYGGFNVTPKDYMHTQIKGTNAKKKEERISHIVGPQFERGRLYIPRPEHNPFVRTFLEHEYRPFPLGEMDLLDSLVLAINEIAATSRITDKDRLFA